MGCDEERGECIMSVIKTICGHELQNAVTSVNGKTGAVALTAADVGALSESGANGVIVNLLDEAKKSGEFDGADGRGIQSIVRTSGDGAAGTVDTYTITYTDETTSTYQVRNGANGKDGDPGPAYTLTAADKQSITAAVVAALPQYAGEVEAV